MEKIKVSKAIRIILFLSFIALISCTLINPAKYSGLWIWEIIFVIGVGAFYLIFQVATASLREEDAMRLDYYKQMEDYANRLEALTESDCFLPYLQSIYQIVEELRYSDNIALLEIKDEVEEKIEWLERVQKDKREDMPDDKEDLRKQERLIKEKIKELLILLE